MVTTEQHTSGATVTVTESAVSREMVEQAIIALLNDWNHPDNENPRTHRRYQVPWSTTLWFRFMRAALNAVIPAGHVVAPATRVLDAADVAALRHLVADHKLVQSEVRQALRDTTPADLARVDRILASDAARTEGQ